MKVVLFCGGLGARLRSFNEHVPKPLVEIGSRPILWHLMKYYAHFGHRDFVLCLGHGASAIKTYFLHYDECVSNDFVLSQGGRQVDLLQRDIDDWRITFVDTGPTSSIGQRLRAVRPHLEGEEVFLANYSDGLSDLDLDVYVEYFLANRRTACFLSVAAPHTFHIVEAEADWTVRKLQAVATSPLRINGGFFAFRQEIFDFIREGEDLVFQPFERLIAARELLAYPYDGFWRNMDTFKDQQHLEALLEAGAAPWQVWRGRSGVQETSMTALLAAGAAPSPTLGTVSLEPSPAPTIRPPHRDNGAEGGLRRQLGHGGPGADAAAGEGSPTG